MERNKEIKAPEANEKMKTSCLKWDSNPRQIQNKTKQIQNKTLIAIIICYMKNGGIKIISLDALFGLPRRKLAGKSY